MKKITTEGFGISLPIHLVKQIDELRGDVTRSRFIQRLIEESLRNRRLRDLLKEEINK